MFVNKSFSLPEENILFDDELLGVVSDDIPFIFRIWESNSHFIVKGLGCPDADVDWDEADKLGIPVLKRRSGGGTVVQGPGCMNYAAIFFAPEPPKVIEAFDMVLGGLMIALSRCGISANKQGICDLCIGNKKFSGNAQRRKQDRFYVHGTILYSFDIGLVDKILNMPSKEPDYRGNRPHGEFILNLPLDKRHIGEIMFYAYNNLKTLSKSG